MVRAPCCSKVGMHRGPWTPREDELLIKHIQAHGEGQWRSLPRKAGLLRCGKSCRLRWMNYLRPDIKRGNITPDEDDLIIRLHALLGNKWSLIAGRLPGRTDNEIKNYWNTYLSKRLITQGMDPNTHKKLSELDPPGRRSGPKKRRNVTPGFNPSSKRKKERKDNGEREKTKIHLPKPVRVTSLSLSRNNSHTSFESNTTTASISSGNAPGGSALPNRDLLWPGYDRHQRTGFLIHCEDQVDPVNGGDDLRGKSSDDPTSDNQLETLYEEYLQLIKADNGYLDDQSQLDLFAESLLA
ncbi:hypothetical protein Nepgr_023597 [Nepenthes gracilis]|uniref:Uncharacterized protein n=1 Tax=Nepenthes gracilis TaxID=150966 RepID=A0AAD3T1I8_NEPGR|nr:hypothetical protein Nepgr_023597 [Nepenthes gracilis]